MRRDAIAVRLGALAAGCVLACAGGSARAWGPLGHRIVAETAALLVDDDLPRTWGPLLSRHRFMLGVYANAPDWRFRFVDGQGGKLEAPTHFLKLDAPPGVEAGSVDRRVAQFLERGREHLGPVKAPVGGYLSGAGSDGDARRIYLGLLDLGLMAHYSGDASMPYHATTDWNGYATGEGGIHFYFENACVDAFEPGLAEDVLQAARAHRKKWAERWNASGTAPRDLVRAVLEESLAATTKVSTLDRRNAIVTLQPPGETKDGVRKPAAEGCRAMRSLVVERLATGSALTALLWESVLPAQGVDFSGARSLLFSDLEAAPDYVPPSYGATEPRP